MIPSQNVVVQTVPQTESAQSLAAENRLKQIKATLKGLGYAELLIGLVCVILGITVLAHVYGFIGISIYNYRPLFCFGEGLWCGVWIMISGSLGVACGNNKLTPCLLNSTMAFSIFGALFSATLCGFASTTSVVNYFEAYRYGYGVGATLAVLGFCTLILCIVSASFCCCASPYLGNDACCGGCCGRPQDYKEGRVVYVMSNQGIAPGQTIVPVASVMPVAQATTTAVSAPPGETSMQEEEFQQTPDNRSDAAVAKQHEAEESLLTNQEQPPAYETENQ